jgi:glucose-6-phosphate isomerase
LGYFCKFSEFAGLGNKGDRVFNFKLELGTIEMSKGPKPFQIELDPKTGIPSRYKDKQVRRLSDLRGFFSDNNLVEKLLARGKNPIIYEVYEIPQIPSEGLFSLACTVLYPGKVGWEYYFTKGHFHSKEPTSEVYVGLEGNGIILLQTRDGRVTSLPLKAGSVVYIPPRWAHRSINTGKGKMVFLAIYPSDAGHDYESIKRSGFARLLVERGVKPRLIKNPVGKGK